MCQNCCKQTILVQLIVENVVTCSFCNTVYTTLHVCSVNKCHQVVTISSFIVLSSTYSFIFIDCLRFYCYLSYFIFIYSAIFAASVIKRSVKLSTCYFAYCSWHSCLWLRKPRRTNHLWRWFHNSWSMAHDNQSWKCRHKYLYKQLNIIFFITLVRVQLDNIQRDSKNFISWGFLKKFSQQLRFFKQNCTHLLYVHIYAKLQILFNYL